MTVELVWRRLVERATRVPSSNLSRVKQGEAIPADVMQLTVGGRMA